MLDFSDGLLLQQMIPSDVENANSDDAIRAAERRALAREVHDTVIQPLTALITSMTCLEQQPLSAGAVEAYMGAWKELAQEALNALRGTLAGLRTHPHARLSLPDALRHYLAPHIRSHGVRLILESEGWPDDLPLDWTSHLYLIVREALTNAEKHAHASEVTVLLHGEHEHLSIIIADNGVGFQLARLANRPECPPGSGLGIGGMEERAQMLGGTLTIATAPGHGVRLELRVPRPNRTDGTDGPDGHDGAEHRSTPYH